MDYRDLLNPATFADEAYLHELTAHMRAHDPLPFIETETYEPLWVCSKHADIVEVERQHTKFLNTARSVLQSREIQALEGEQGPLLRTLINMDEPEHQSFRDPAKDWFMPNNLGKVEGRVQAIAKAAVDRMLAVPDRSNVDAAYERIAQAGIPVAHRIGQHPNDELYTFYVVSPSGFEAAIGAEAVLAEDDRPVGYWDGMSIWGHETPVAQKVRMAGVAAHNIRGRLRNRLSGVPEPRLPEWKGSVWGGACPRPRRSAVRLRIATPQGQPEQTVT